MARRAQKRQADEEQPRSDAEPPAKKTKTRSDTELEAWWNWVYPPQFWDNLSELNLTHKAVRELNRRNRLQPREKRQHHVKTPLPFKNIAQFARHGGPDLCDIRGYRLPPKNMDSSSSRGSRATFATGTASTVPTSVTGQTKKSKKSTPYNRDFEVHLEDHGIHASHFSKRPDLKEIKEALKAPRASLSPSRFPEEAFDAFEGAYSRARDEDEVVANIIPTILGQPRPDLETARNTTFGNLEPITDGSIVQASPDFYDGAQPRDLDRSIRAKLSKHIVPSTMLDKPLAPNFFLEVKGPDGSTAVAKRQARYDGAIGSRAMHTLQNYGEEEPKYDGQPHSFSSIYHEGTLQLYAHHVTAPKPDKDHPEYHITQIKSFAINSDHETFLQGATAVRNVRDLAKQHRDSFIQAANARESQLRILASADILPSVEGDDLVPVPDPSEPRDNDNHDTDGQDSQNGPQSPAVLQPPVNEDNSDNSQAVDDDDGCAVHADEPYPTGAPSFPPAMNGKRQRQSESPPSTSGDIRPPQVRKRLDKDQAAETVPCTAATAIPTTDEVENGAGQI